MSVKVNPLNPTREANIARVIAKIETLLEEERKTYFAGVTTQQSDDVIEPLKNLKEIAQSNVVGFNSFDLGKKALAMFLLSLRQTLVAGGILKEVESGKLTFEIRALLETTEIISHN